ncbi:MAG: tRNA (adenosine(37)-N6)-threonylcarbamoyltransferase complex ATPase subunit type 1 TsaE [Desulfatiglandales bacterium]
MAEKKHLLYLSTSDVETVEFGRRVASHLMAGDVLALVGELGSGKTWFTKGVALGLGVSPRMVVPSPTFALINEYEGRFPLYHMDVYRLQSISEFISAGLEEYLYSKGVAVMEWADRWPEILPEGTLTISFAFVDEHRREITLSGTHARAFEIIDKIEEGMNRG